MLVGFDDEEVDWLLDVLCCMTNLIRVSSHICTYFTFGLFRPHTQWS